MTKVKTIAKWNPDTKTVVKLEMAIIMVLNNEPPICRSALLKAVPKLILTPSSSFNDSVMVVDIKKEIPVKRTM